MVAHHQSRDSWWALAADVASARVLVWSASWGRDVELTPDAHLYFFDRYQRLADYHRRRGHNVRERQLQAKADAHHQLSGGGPPYAAAMAMPRPGRFIRTEAVSRNRLGGGNDAA